MTEPLLIDLIREWELHSNPKHHCYTEESDEGMGVCPVREYKYLGTFLAMNERPQEPSAVVFGHKMTEQNRNYSVPVDKSEPVRVSDEQLSYYIGDYVPEPDIINRSVDRHDGKPKSVKELREAGRPIVNPDSLYLYRPVSAEYPCPTKDCGGDARYSAPGRGHRKGCHYPFTEGAETHEDAPRLIVEHSAVEETMDYFKDRLDEILSAVNEVNERLTDIEKQQVAGRQFSVSQWLSDIARGVENMERGFDN